MESPEAERRLRGKLGRAGLARGEATALRVIRGVGQVRQQHAEVEGQRQPEPFQTHLFQATQQEPPCSEVVFDDRERTFGGVSAAGVFLL